MSKILIIDSTNNFLRCYSVIPTLTTNGECNGGVYGFLNSLSFFIRQTKPDKVILCWDGVGGSKKRRAIIKEYKDGRKPVRLNRNFEYEMQNPEENKLWQRRRLGQYLNDLPVTQITVDDVEADDVVAYLIKMYDQDQKIIVSSDKDFYQLLDERTIIFSPIKKVFVNNRDILEQFKIHPLNFALARAIIGDKTDNLIGVRGIGFKNIVKFFPCLAESKQYRLEELLALSEAGGDKYKKFIENKDLIEKNLKVMKLDTVLMSYGSTTQIHEEMEKPLSMNATSFRLKLLEDGIKSIHDNYLQEFKILQMKGNP